MKKLNKTFKINPLYEADGYKVGHKKMLAPNTTKLYGTWIPRSLKYMHPSITKIMSAGHQFVVRYLHSTFQENFFDQPINVAEEFVKDMSDYLMLPYNGEHFLELHKLGYLPIKIKALPEGIFTNPNIPHQTYINTIDGYAWLTLYLETYISKLSWQISTVATIGHKFKQNAVEWTNKTDKDNLWLTDYMCHDFHSRGGNPFTSIAAGLGHSFTNKGSDTLNVISASRYYYDVPKNEVCINSVNASEHSVSTTKIFTVGEQQMIADWLKEFNKGILSIVSDTFDLWKLITEYLPTNKEAIMSRDGKLVIRPDSGDPVDIICGIQEIKDLTTLLNLPSGTYFYKNETFIFKKEEWLNILSDYDKEIHLEEALFAYLKKENLEGFRKWNGNKVIYFHKNNEFVNKGVIELLWGIFGGTINEQGYKVLDSHIGAIYGDSINLERQVEIYKRLEAKGFAATNIVLGVGSYSYVYMTRDQAGFAAKGAWFESEGIGYNIYKDPITDSGTKKSLKGKVQVATNLDGEIVCYQECSSEEEYKGMLQTIYEDGKFFNQTTLTEIRNRLS